MNLIELGQSKKGWWVKTTGTLVAAFLILTSLLRPQFFASANGTSLTIEPISWNVIGLDSNNVSVGPNDFPVGARVCNTGGSPTTVTSINFVWDDSQGIYTSSSGANTYINLRDGSFNTISNVTLATGACTDAYFEVIVNRDSSAYNKVRQYYITATDPGGTVSTPKLRELFVEHLISQNRNSTNAISYSTNGSTFTSVSAGGNMHLSVGSTYWIKLDASTATQGYNQLENFITLSNTIFQVLEVQSYYSANSSSYVANSSDKLYADACLWDNDPASLTYRSCVGSDGKVGGTISTTYKVKIISGAGTSQTLNSLIYDFSGSSYHYNSDYSTETRFASISSPLTLSKSFSPVSIASGGTSTLSIAITNSSSSAVTGVSLTDTLPALVTISGIPATPQCGGTISSTSGSLIMTDMTIPVGSCTVSATVTSSSINTYANITDHLFINGSDTGLSANANLTVAAIVPPGGICGLTLAKWEMTSTVAAEITNPPGPTSDITGNTAAASAGVGISTIIDSSGTNSWRADGFANTSTINTANNEYLQFAVNTSLFNTIGFQFDEIISFNAVNEKIDGPQNLALFSSTNGSVFTQYGSAIISNKTWTTHNPTFSGIANTSGLTYFRIYGYNPGSPGNNDYLYLDNITITGCGTAIKPTLTKAFSPNPIPENGTSTLTFTLTNTNTVALTGAKFSDSLPADVTISVPPATPQCGGTISYTSDSITLTGGTIPAKVGSENGSCIVTAIVTSASAGVYNNTSGFISTIESGTNTGSDGFGSATLTVLAPPVISKSFSPNPIYSGEASTVTFTITNPNSGNDLTGVGFTDSLPTSPGEMKVALSPNYSTSGCGLPTFAPAANDPSLTFTGGTIVAGGTCTVKVDVTASTTGNYTNTTSAVSSTNAGTGNTASDTLVVQDVHPGISILKQVSISATGPWTRTVNVIAGGNVYYRLTIENIGDVPLSPVSVEDDLLDISSCVWPVTLPVGTSIIDPTASCLLGPVTALEGSHDNTATAHGTYAGTVYDSSSTATYVTTQLTLAKTVTEPNFSAVGNILNYTYTITNNGPEGSDPLSLPATVNDSKIGSVFCPTADSSATPDSFLDPGESTVCNASYTVTAFDMSVGSITNTAFATVSGIRTNNAQAFVYRDLPDLTITKTNDTGGIGTVGTPFTWKLKVTNQGPMAATFASGSFASLPPGILTIRYNNAPLLVPLGQTILSDQLPASGADYGTPTVDSIVGIPNAGDIYCSIDGSYLLICAVAGDDVAIAATSGSFVVNIPTTPNASGSLVNTATVDPDDHVDEGNEGNSKLPPPKAVALA